jgi:hypothetical protein
MFGAAAKVHDISIARCSGNGSVAVQSQEQQVRRLWSRRWRIAGLRGTASATAETASAGGTARDADVLLAIDHE